MAWIRDYAVTEVTSASTNPSASVVFPVHQANDYLLMMLAVDGAVIPALPTDWIDIENQAGVAQAFRLCYKLAASSSEVCPTLSLGTTNEWHIGVFSIAGAPSSNPISTSAKRSTTDAASPFEWTASATTGTDANCLIFQFCNSDTALSLTCLTNGYTNLVNGDAGTAGFGCAYAFKPTAGAITDASWDGNTDNNTTACLVAWKDDGNGTRPSYADPQTSGRVITSLGGTSLINADSNPASLTYGAIGMRDFDQVWAYDGTSVYTDKTTDINDTGTADVAIDNVVDAAWYFGYDYKFNHIVLQISTAQVGGTVAWEYWDGSVWTNLAASGALTIARWERFRWTMPAAMTPTSVNGVTKYYVRMRLSATFTTAPVLSRGHVGGWPTLFDAVGNTAGAGVNPYRDAMTLTPAATTSFCGSERAFGSAQDMDTGVFVLHHRAYSPRDYAADTAISNMSYPVTQVGEDGVHGNLSGYAGFLVVLGDASDNYEAYAIHSKLSKCNSNIDFNTCCIGLNNGAKPYGTIGAVNKSAITRALFLIQGPYGGPAFAYASALSMCTEVVLAGGDATHPMRIADVVQVANNCVGSSLYLNGVGDFQRVYVPLRFGGNHPVKTLVDGAIFQFPTAYDGKSYTDFNGSDNVLGVTFYGTGSGDQLKFPNCTWKGSQPFRWEFHASHSGDAVLDFTGNTVQGATVTLRATANLDSVSFLTCPMFTQNGATLTNCTFTNTKVSASAPADVALISSSTFKKTAGTRHGIEISGTAADITLTDLTFTGYASSDGSTGNEAIYVNIASGSMTINVSGGTTPSIRTAGATVTVVNSVTVTLTGLKNPSEVRVFNAGTTTERSGTGAEDVTGGTHAFSLPANTSVDISVLSLGYQNMRILAYSTPTSATLPISQVLDRQYLNP